MAPNFFDNLVLWLILTGPIAAWVFLFWLTSPSGEAASKLKKEKAKERKQHKSLDRIASALEKNSPK
jgi:hypothetical protein